MQDNKAYVLEPLSDETIFGVPPDLLPAKQPSENVCGVRKVDCSAWEYGECKMPGGCIYDI